MTAGVGGWRVQAANASKSATAAARPIRVIINATLAR
jgi:hypothetical protein